jgi:hypothetical protein
MATGVNAPTLAAKNAARMGHPPSIEKEKSVEISLNGL